MSAMLHLNNDDVLENDEWKDIDDDCHDYDWFDENEAIDADIQKSIDDVIDLHCEIEFDEYDIVRLSIMLSILLVFRVEIEMKV
jgi:uncharacterized protein (DUF924 family)